MKKLKRFNNKKQKRKKQKNVLCRILMRKHIMDIIKGVLILLIVEIILFFTLIG